MRSPRVRDSRLVHLVGRHGRPHSWMWSRQSAGTRPAGPGAGWSSGWDVGGASSGPSTPFSLRVVPEPGLPRLEGLDHRVPGLAGSAPSRAGPARSRSTPRVRTARTGAGAPTNRPPRRTPRTPSRWAAGRLDAVRRHASRRYSRLGAGTRAHADGRCAVARPRGTPRVGGCATSWSPGTPTPESAARCAAAAASPLVASATSSGHVGWSTRSAGVGAAPACHQRL